MGAFDDLVPAEAVEPEARGVFDDLVPGEETARGAFDDLVPKAAGQIRGLAGALQRGWLTAQMTPDVVAAASVPPARSLPSIPKQWAAWERSMLDPVYQDALTQSYFDPRRLMRVEGALGPGSQLEMAQQGRRATRQALAEDVATQMRRVEAVPKSAAQQEMASAKTNREQWAAWLRNPIELTASIALESLPPSIAGAMAGTVAAGPGAGTALGAGLASGAMTFASEFLAEAQKSGYATDDPRKLEAFLDDPVTFGRALDVGLKKAGVVGSVDAATAGAAGRFIGPALRQGLKQRLLATGKELVMQAAGGAGGEMAGEMLSGQPISTFDVAMEALAEVASGPGEILGNVIGERPAAALAARPREQVKISEFGGVADEVGDAKNLPGTGGVEAAPAAETPTPPATAAAGPSAETPSPAQAAADNTGAVPTNESEVMPDAVQGQERTEGTEVAADELREGPTRATVPQHESATVQRREQTGGPEGRQLPDRGGQPGSQPPTPQSAPRPVRSSSPESKALLAKAVEAKVDALYSDALSKGKEDLARGIASAWRDIQPMLEAMSPADALREINRIMDVARAQRNEALRGPVRVPAGVDAKTGKLQYDEVTIGPEVAVYNIGRRRAAAIYREAILEQQEGDAVERWLDRAIAATDPAQGRLMEGVTGLPVWLTQTAANLALRAAKLAYTTTRDLARAIAAGVEALREMQIAGFNEAEARDWLTRTLGERATGQKIGASSAVSEQTKQAVREYLYERRNNAADDALAAGLLERVGLDQAEAIIRERSADVPGAVWSRLLRVVTRQMAEAEREARANQDEATAQAWASRQAALWDTVLPQITDVAQTLQALNDLVAMSPDGMVALARNTVDRANTERLEHRRAETEQMQQALDEGRKTGIEAVRNDPEVNAKARAAVDEAVAESEETRRAVIMELAEPWAQSSAVLAHARAAVRAKAEELLNRGPRPPGLTPAQHLRQILDDLAKRAAGIAAWHYQGAEPGTTLAQKLEARLGLTKEHAERLAKQLDAEFARQFEAAKRKLSKRIAEARARLALRQADKERELGTQTGLDKAIMRQLRALNTRLGEVLRDEAGRRDETGRHVAERVVAESGLTGAKADALRAALTRRWNELVSEAQRRALAAIEKRSGVRVGRTLRNAFDKLVELDRLGALSSEKFFEVVKKALKLQRLTEADARKLRRLVELAQSKPEGWQRQRAMTDVLTFVEELKGDLSWWQAAMSIWYANIFSSPTTHAKNIIGNGLKLMETMAVELLHRPLAARQLLWALAEGTRKGMLEAASIMRTGKVEGTRLLKLEPARPLEAKRLPGNLDYLLTFFRVVGRAMATEDMVPFKANEEIRWAMVARRIARREGLPMWGRKLNQRVQELMHNTKADWESAKVQAAKEGLTGLDLLRRANEIIEQRREASMPGSLAVARQFALKQTYNADPYGLMGAIAGVLNNMNRSLQFTRFFVPVVRIVANLANESLNYFPPVGLSRVALTRWGPNEVRVFGKSWYFRNRIDGKPITDPDAMFHQTAVAAAGTVLFTALAWAVGRSVEDEDPPIALYGQGPRSRSQREQLRKTGWIPDSIKIGGRYYSYKESQLSIPLAILGNWFDAIRWKHLNEEDALNRMAYAAQTFSNTFLDRGMLSGVTSLLDALNPTGGQAGTQLTKALAKPASSIVVPNALRFIDNVFDPQMYEVDDVQGALLAQVPWARRAGRPALNAFGEPVERRPLDQFIVPQKPDPLVVLLASKSAWVPMPILDKQTVGKAEWGKDWLRPMTPDEYYQWIATSGPEIRRRLTDEMDRIRDMEDDEARAFVSKIAEQERAKAKREFVY